MDTLKDSQYGYIQTMTIVVFGHPTHFDKISPEKAFLRSISVMKMLTSGRSLNTYSNLFLNFSEFRR